MHASYSKPPTIFIDGIIENLGTTIPPWGQMGVWWKIRNITPSISVFNYFEPADAMPSMYVTVSNAKKLNYQS